MVLCFDVILAIVVRLILLIHSLLVIWLATSITRTKEYWLLAVADLGLIIEGLVTIIVNKAQEWKWFCPCFFFYLCSTIPGIWILELNRMDAYQEKQGSLNSSVIKQAQGLDDIQGITIPIQMETDTWVIIMEQLFLYLMILGRWVLPRGEISRNELSQLLFVFIGIASDITELFALFEENKVRENTGLTYAILCVWTVSLLQFTFVLTSTHSPRKTRMGFQTDEEPELDEDEPHQGCLKSFFQTEVWSICVNFLFQDGPYLTVRMYTMVAFQLLTYSIIFFTAKNALLVMLLVYRLCVLCCDKKKPKSVSSSPAASKHSLSLAGSRQSLGSKTGNFIVMANNDSRKNVNNGLGSRSGSKASLTSQGRIKDVYSVPL